MPKASLQFAACVSAALMLAPLALAQQTATPTITPAAGTYAAGQLVTITDATPGAVIYYGDHGVIPTTTKGTRYTGPFLMTSVYDTVNAIAIAPGMTQSAVAQVKYVVPPPPAATPVFVQPAGDYPSGQLITITDATPGATIYYGIHGETPTTRGRLYTGPIAVSSVETVKAIAVAPGYGQSAMATAKYTALEKAAAPVFSPMPGDYLFNQNITMTTSTSGAYIYYTTDGSTPTIASRRYAGFLPIRGPVTIKAIASHQPEFFDSNVIAVTYGLRTPTPVIFPAGGSLLTSYSVSISDTLNPSSIYYTVDGTTPTAASTPYTGPFTVAQNETVKAVAVSPGYAVSDAASANFVIAMPTQKIYQVAGSPNAGYSGDGGPAMSAQLNYPQGVAVDTAGNLYIADTGNHVIRKIAADTGIITTVAGTYPFPEPIGGTGDGGPATDAKLFLPNAVAVDSNDNLYIADTSNFRVRKVDAQTGIITAFAGVRGSLGTDPPAPGQLAKDYPMGYPTGVAVDSNDNVYIADEGNNRILRVDAATGVIRIVAGSLNRSGGFPINGGPAISADMTFPKGVAIDSGDLLYIANTSAFEINRVDLNQELIYITAGNASAGYSGDGGPATDATFYQPEGIAFDSHNNLYIADAFNHLIRQVSAETGIIVTVAGDGAGSEGNGGGKFGGDGGLAIKAHLNTPSGVAVGSDGTLYIADTYNCEIRKVTGLTPAP